LFARTVPFISRARRGVDDDVGVGVDDGVAWRRGVRHGVEMGWPDMRLPILYSIAWPHRIAMPPDNWEKPLDLIKLGQMTFKGPDTTKCVTTRHHIIRSRPDPDDPLPCIGRIDASSASPVHVWRTATHCTSLHVTVLGKSSG
jgi:hypothetical protein